MPVTEAYRRYEESIAVLGCIDVDFLCRSEKNVFFRLYAPQNYGMVVIYSFSCPGCGILSSDII